MKQLLFFVWSLLVFTVANAQETNSLYKNKTIVSDSLTQMISLDSVALNNNYFKITDKQGFPIDSLCYSVDFNSATLTLEPLNDTLWVSYLNNPNFLTQTYPFYITKLIFPTKDA